MNKTSQRTNHLLSQLRQDIVRSFNKSEIETLWFDLDFDFENFKHETKDEIVCELIAYTRRAEITHELVAKLETSRPKVSWPLAPDIALISPQATDWGGPVQQRIRKYVSNAKSAKTLHEYKRHWQDFVTFCAQHGYETSPAAPAAVADFLTYVADAGAKVSTIQVKAAAISYAHDSAHLENPMRTVEVKETLRGIRRTLGTAQKGKEPVTLEQLRQIVQSLPVNLRGARDKAIVLIGWAGAFRRSELVALELADVKFERDQVSIVVRRSKTDQEGRGMKKVIPILKDKSICPVQALRDWLDDGDVASGPIFRPIDRWGHVANRALKPQEVARTVKRCAALADLDVEQLSGHSLRAGYVTEAADHDVPTWQIREQTGHKNDQVLQRYIRDRGRGAKRATRAAFGEE